MPTELRYRRSMSSSRIIDDEKDREIHFKTSPDEPLHKMVESPFSTASGFTNFRGLLNLGIILLVVSNFRVALENIMKYGILVDPFQLFHIFISGPCELATLALVFAANVFIIFSLALEKILLSGRFSEKLALCLQSLGLVGFIVWGCALILYRHPSPFISAPMLGVYCVLCLKMWSYHRVNSWCRQAYLHKVENHRKQSKVDGDNRRTSGRPSRANVAPTTDGDKNGTTTMHYEQHDEEARYRLACQLHLMDDTMEAPPQAVDDTVSLRGRLKYPANLSLKNIYYFVCAPTLCYELNFPRNVKIRKRFLLKRVAEVVFLPQIVLCLAQQWIMPLLHNSTRLKLSQASWSAMCERLLKLAIPNHLLWLIFFYWFFHALLNLLAELLLFADRCFYLDWWNSATVTQFWSSWNIPVHRWARRHIFLPLVARRWSKPAASMAVFLLSALLHELLVSVPLRMFRLWAFAAMLSQVPLAIFMGKYLRGYHQLGNMIVWISLIIGQPLALLMYFHDYYMQNMLSVGVNSTVGP